MKPISFHDFRPAPGLVVEWTVSPEAAVTARSAPTDSIPLSYNQELHLQAAHTARRAGLPGNPCIGASFELEGAADLDALGRAFTAWLRRHEALRSGFRAGQAAIERFTLTADAIDLVQDTPVDLTSSEALHARLDARFAAGTDPFAWPPLVLGVISREAGSTVFIALDHVAGDAFSFTWQCGSSRRHIKRSLRTGTPSCPRPAASTNSARPSATSGHPSPLMIRRYKNGGNSSPTAGHRTDVSFGSRRRGRPAVAANRLHPADSPTGGSCGVRSVLQGVRGRILRWRACLHGHRHPVDDRATGVPHRLPAAHPEQTQVARGAGSSPALPWTSPWKGHPASRMCCAGRNSASSVRCAWRPSPHRGS